MKKIVAACVVALSAAAALPPSPARAAFPGRPGAVIFQGSAGGSDADDSTSNLYRIGRNGNGLTQLTEDGVSHSPSVSPDGKRVVFGCRRFLPRRAEICIRNIDGSGRRRLTRNRTFDGDATWSPDGTKILFSRYIRSARSDELFTMSPRGDNVRRITHNRITEAYAVWKPGGNRIAYSRIDLTGRDRQVDIFTIRPDGTRKRRITRSEVEEQALDWHPKANRLVFVRRGHLAMKRIGRRGVRRITGGKGSAWAPAWSPHGRKIVFQRHSRGTRPSGLVKVDPRDRSMSLLLEAPAPDENGHCQPGLCAYTEPTWQPRT